MSEIVGSRPHHSQPIGNNQDGVVVVSDDYQSYFDDLEFAINLSVGDFLQLPVFTVTTLPVVPALPVMGFIGVSDETGGAIPAFSDGTNWLRVTDRAIIS